MNWTQNYSVVLAMASLKDKVVLITGSGDETGIGGATAVYMVQYQPRLVLTGRDEARLQRVGQLCKEAGLAEDRILQVVADVTKDSDLERLVDTTITTFKQIDVLINNAGIVFYKSFLDMSMEEYDLVMNTNLRSPVYLTKLCLPHLIKTKGSIVNIGSISGSKAYTNHVPYCLSKAGLDHFTNIMAMECAPHGVRVNAVNPAIIVTNIKRKAGLSEEEYQLDMGERSRERHPLGRAGTTTEVAKAIVFLASDQSSFTTGHLLFVDGGRCVKPW